MHARSTWFISFAIFVSVSSGAYAAVSVFGSPAAVTCFEQADAGSTDPKSCDQALQDPDMLERDRASTYVNRGIIYNTARKVNLALADFAASAGTSIVTVYLASSPL